MCLRNERNRLFLNGSGPCFLLALLSFYLSLPLCSVFWVQWQEGQRSLWQAGFVSLLHTGFFNETQNDLGFWPLKFLSAVEWLNLKWNIYQPFMIFFYFKISENNVQSVVYPSNEMPIFHISFCFSDLGGAY